MATTTKKRTSHSRCFKENEINLMVDRMERIEDTIQGKPGLPGLLSTVIVLNNNVENSTKSIEKLSITIEKLALSNAEKEGENNANQKNSINTKWLKGMLLTMLGLIITLGVAFGTILIKYKERPVQTMTTTKTETQNFPQQKTPSN